MCLVKVIFHPGENIYKHLYFQGDITVPVDESRSFRIRHYGYQVENDTFWAGLENGWEPLSISLWMKLVRDSEVIIDVGANTGIYSLIAKTLNPAARVYAFEPILRVYDKLVSNVRLNGFEIDSFDAALSNTDGEAVVYDTPAEHVYSVTINKNLNADDVEVIPTNVKVARLDTFIRQNNVKKIDLIKLDVETHEVEVLEGMGEFLGKFKPTFLIEILNDEVGQKVEEIVKDLDYLYFNLNEKSGSIRKVEKILKSDYYNYLFCDRKIAEKLTLIK
jgi:FkbM family methyltransferase